MDNPNEPPSPEVETNGGELKQDTTEQSNKFTNPDPNERNELFHDTANEAKINLQPIPTETVDLDGNDKVTPAELEETINEIGNKQTPLDARISLVVSLLQWQKEETEENQDPFFDKHYYKLLDIIKNILVEPNESKEVINTQGELSTQMIAREMAKLLFAHCTERFSDFIMTDLLVAILFVIRKNVDFIDASSLPANQLFTSSSIRAETMKYLIECLPKTVPDEQRLKHVFHTIMEVSKKASKAPALQQVIIQKLDTMTIDAAPAVTTALLTPHIDECLRHVRAGQDTSFCSLLTRSTVFFNAHCEKLLDNLDVFMDRLSFSDMKGIVEEVAELHPLRLLPALPQLLVALGQEVMEHKMLILGILLAIALVSVLAMAPMIGPVGALCTAHSVLYVPLVKLAGVVSTVNPDIARECLKLIVYCLKTGLAQEPAIQSALLEGINVIKDHCGYANLFSPATVQLLATVAKSNPTAYDNVMAWNKGKRARIGDQKVLLLTAGQPQLQSQIPSSLSQIPNSLSQIPSSQSQIPNSQTQIPNSQSQIPSSPSQIPTSSDSSPGHPVTPGEVRGLARWFRVFRTTSSTTSSTAVVKRKHFLASKKDMIAPTPQSQSLAVLHSPLPPPAIPIPTTPIPSTITTSHSPVPATPTIVRDDDHPTTSAIGEGEGVVGESLHSVQKTLFVEEQQEEAETVSTPPPTTTTTTSHTSQSTTTSATPHTTPHTHTTATVPHTTLSSIPEHTTSTSHTPSHTTSHTTNTSTSDTTISDSHTLSVDTVPSHTTTTTPHNHPPHTTTSTSTNPPPASSSPTSHSPTTATTTTTTTTAAEVVPPQHTTTSTTNTTTGERIDEEEVEEEKADDDKAEEEEMIRSATTTNTTTTTPNTTMIPLPITGIHHPQRASTSAIPSTTTGIPTGVTGTTNQQQSSQQPLNPHHDIPIKSSISTASFFTSWLFSSSSSTAVAPANIPPTTTTTTTSTTGGRPMTTANNKKQNTSTTTTTSNTPSTTTTTATTKRGSGGILRGMLGGGVKTTPHSNNNNNKKIAPSSSSAGSGAASTSALSTGTGAGSGGGNSSTKRVMFVGVGASPGSAGGSAGSVGDTKDEEIRLLRARLAELETTAIR